MELVKSREELGTLVNSNNDLEFTNVELRNQLEQAMAARTPPPAPKKGKK